MHPPDDTPPDPLPVTLYATRTAPHTPYRECPQCGTLIADVWHHGRAWPVEPNGLNHELRCYGRLNRSQHGPS